MKLSIEFNWTDVKQLLKGGSEALAGAIDWFMSRTSDDSEMVLVDKGAAESFKDTLDDIKRVIFPEVKIDAEYARELKDMLEGLGHEVVNPELHEDSKSDIRS